MNNDFPMTSSRQAMAGLVATLAAVLMGALSATACGSNAANDSTGSASSGGSGSSNGVGATTAASSSGGAPSGASSTGTQTGTASAAGGSGSGSAAGTSSSSAAASSGSGSGGASGGASGDGGCQASAECAAGQTCDVDYRVCCPAYALRTVEVDGVVSFEQPCCGNSAAEACGSVTHAMDLLQQAGISGATIHAYNSDSSADWAPSLGNAPERWPIRLGLGVTLSAPGIYFAPPVRGETAFAIAGFSAADVAPVTIAGSAAAPVYLGQAFSGLNGSNCTIAVDEATDAGPRPPLTLSGASLAGSSIALNIGAGAQVTLGPLPVSLLAAGNTFNPDQFPGVIGPVALLCQGPDAGLRDLASGDGGVVSADGQGGTALFVGAGCQAELTRGPQLSVLSGGSCNDNVGALVSGSGRLLFGSGDAPGVIHCAYDADLDMEATAVGAPQVTLAGATLEDACVGAYVNGGTLRAAATSFVYSFIDLWANGQAQTIDLAGDGGPATANTLACAGVNQENTLLNSCRLNGAPAVFFTSNFAGTEVLNLTAATPIDARNVVWQQYANDQAQLWSCPSTFVCTCSGPGCPETPIPQNLTDRVGQNYPPKGEAISLASFEGTAIDSRGGSQLHPPQSQCSNGN